MAPTQGPRVDISAPLLHVEHVLKTGKMVHDIERERTLARENRELLKKINQIYRSQGFLNVDYSYRAHQSLNSESHMLAARTMERENRVLLERLLRRKPTVDSNLRHGCKTLLGFPEIGETSPQLMIDFWERTDRWLCQLTVISSAKETLTDPLEKLTDSLRRGNIKRIFRDTCLVLRSQPISQDEKPSLGESDTLHQVAKGCLVRQRQGQREHLLITLREIASICGGSLLGNVGAGSMAKLDLLNYYGTKFGRCREPIFYDVRFMGNCCKL
uniref:Uncharacterized protein n=1 Tax=Anopheles atroparvus TaxID=41427 RepID=A0AAG5DDF8_ANOAO